MRDTSVRRKASNSDTTNTDDYLQDKTGNRRFWPVDVGRHPATKTVWNDLDRELDQLWAEAMVYWRMGEPLYISSELSNEAHVQQEAHREVSTREGLILEFLERPIPKDWRHWDLDRRRMFWSGNVSGQVELGDRKSTLLNSSHI